jgi:iduronate 2-sulfatase
MKSLRSTVYAVLLAFVGAVGAAVAAGAAPRPNVLFIISDDLNTHLGCYGDPIARTPNIDRLAKRGVRFERAYAQYPVCNPSRTSFLSGLRPETSGVMDQQTLLKQKRPDVVYLPEHFAAHGYFTAAIGKVEHGWHNDAKWDLKDEIKGAGPDDEDANGPRPKRARPGQARSATPRQNGGEPPYLRERATEDERDPENADTLIAERVVKLLETPRDQPWLVCVGFHKPHVPHVAPKKFFDLYPLDRIPLTQVPADDAQDIPPVALASKLNFQPNLPAEQQRRIIRAYLACVSYLDEQLGVVLRAMDRLQLWDNTVVVLIGDHGWHFGEHHLWAKASLFEESVRAPLLVVAPGAKAGSACPRVVEFLDIYPTLTDLCGLPQPPRGEGRSLAPLLREPQRAWPYAAFSAVRHARGVARSVRTERWRYTEWDGGRLGVELYDHDRDPGEFKNLAKDERYADVVARMRKLLGANPPAATP